MVTVQGAQWGDERFAALDGRAPLEIPDPPAGEAWRRFRWDSITGAVEGLAAAAREHGTPITAAVFPSPSIARRLVRHDWDRWPLDRFCPMLYQGFYLEDVPWIGDGVREGVAALAATDRDVRGGVATPLNAGFYLPSLDPVALAEAVATAR